ncbi:MAG: Outer membrane protein assembly factor BamB [Fimbriimonadaceae bacterium]|nr:Outer membrane protein assembly factor BamB [Fimbriimonadaceae bacterium]
MLVLTALSGAWAQFEGPAPLAWRWAQPTSVTPGGMPVVQGESVFVAVGSRIYCIDRATGNQKWRYPAGEPLDGAFRHGLIASDGTVVAAADNRTAYAVDMATGQGKWQVSLPATPRAMPVIAGGAVVIALADDSLISIGIADGKPLWANPERIFDGILGEIAGYGSSVLVFNQNYELFSIDVNTKKVNWKLRFSSLGPEARPTVNGDTVYIVNGDFISALHAGTGRRKWERDVREPLTLNPSVSQEGILTVTRDGKLMTFDPSGRPTSKKPIDLGTTPITDPSGIGRLVAVPTSNGALNLIDVRDGKTVWSYIVRPITNYISSSGGSSGGNGSSGQSLPTFVTAASPPVLAGQTLLLLAADGSLLAFDRTLGVDLTAPSVKLLWPRPGDQTSGQSGLEIFWRLADEASGVNPDTIVVKVGDQVLEHAYTGDGILHVRIGSGKNQPLTEGRKELAVTCTDWMGNTATHKVALIIDNTLPVLRPPTDATGTGGTGGGGGKGKGKGGGGIDG